MLTHYFTYQYCLFLILFFKQIFYNILKLLKNLHFLNKRESKQMRYYVHNILRYYLSLFIFRKFYINIKTFLQFLLSFYIQHTKDYFYMLGIFYLSFYCMILHIDNYQDENYFCNNILVYHLLCFLKGTNHPNIQGIHFFRKNHCTIYFDFLIL